MMSAPTIVMGEGLSAVAVIQELVRREEPVIWVDGAGAKILSPMPHVRGDAALALLARAAEFAGIPHGSAVERGLCHRIYRTKAFRLPNWKKAEAQLWAPEKALLGEDERRVEGLDPALVQETLRAKLETHPLVTRIENTPIIEFEVFSAGGKIQFADGRMSEFKRLYFCDDIGSLRGFPKLASIFKGQIKDARASSRHGALQVVFQHSVPLRQFMSRGVLVPMNRESGEEFDRDVMGFFIEPLRSVWTVFLQPSECEENHEIMKKLRKLKQSLNRAFEGPEFLPEGVKEFTATVEKETVRFEASYLYTEGEVRASEANGDFVLLTDSFGVSRGLEQIARHFEVPAMEFGLDSGSDSGTEAQAEPAPLPPYEGESPELPPSI